MLDDVSYASRGRSHRLLFCLALFGFVLGFGARANPSGPVTWGQTVNVTGGGWGRMIQLTNGHWLCVSTIFPPGTNSYLALYRSTDQCRNWTRISQVNESARTLDNGEVVALPNGVLLVTMRSLVGGSSYRLPVYRSTNNGVSWSYLSNIDSSEGLGTRGLWEPDFWVLADGRLTVTYSNEKHDGYSQLISQRLSSDGGETWGPETYAVAQPGGGNLRPGMSQMTRMANGKYILVHEVVNLGNADVYSKISEDGVTWPPGLGQRVPCHHCGPFVTSLPDSRLLISSCENQYSFSDDFGESWQKLDPPAWDLGYLFSWPAVYSIRTNEIGAMISSGGVKIRFGALSPPLFWPNPFIEQFSSGTDTNWSRYGTNFDFANGRYLLNNSGTYGKALAGDTFWSDGTLEADVLISAGGDAGLMFRTTNPDYAGPDHAFGYYAGLNASGSVVLGRMSNAWTHLTSVPVAVALNTWHRLKVTMQGSSIKVFVNDLVQPKITWTDSTFRRGQIGVRSYNANAQFDNISFSNAAPIRLNLRRSGNLLNFTWPQNSQNLQLCSTDKPGAAAWNVVTNPGTLSTGQWSLALPIPPALQQVYQLQPK
jgi:hypothetical protein